MFSVGLPNPVLVLVVLGIIIRATANGSKEWRIRFDDKCKSNQLCTFDLFVQEDAPGPFYVYFHFNNFHVNHRKVLRSFSSSQLKGDSVPFSTLETSCSPMIRNKDPNVTSYFNNPNATVDPEGTLNPCGLMPTLMPAGTFASRRQNRHHQA